MNRKAQYNVLNRKPSKITTWLTENPIPLIIIVVIIIGLALWSIQYLSCNSGLGGACLKVLCFGKIGFC